ncbi:DoxX family protein [Solimonas marina]|uniref:DoxX family protein n=1 Tax=Solimonas marina TaxID=2714601 RepID=A0A969W955_9GAMM|nr:DoxX family protein [Solimonas marina]NKF23021.1 DoxX family protein [Solimonas marina]
MRAPPSWAGRLATRAASPPVHAIALLCLCSAYLQGGLVKLFAFPAAIDEMHSFGLAPAALFAALTLSVELLASVLVLSGRLRWFGALTLAAFTLMATLIANRDWHAADGIRGPVANAFFEHLGLTGGFLLVAWQDLQARSAP